MRHRIRFAALCAFIIALAGTPHMASAQDATHDAGAATAAAPTPTPGTVADPGATAAGEPAFAEPTPAEKAKADPVGTAAQVVKDIKSGNWRMVAAGVLALLMLLAAKARSQWKWFRGKRGGAVLVLVLGLAGSFSAALATSSPLDLSLFVGALGVTWTAVGGYTHIRRIIWPSDAADPGNG